MDWPETTTSDKKTTAHSNIMTSRSIVGRTDFPDFDVLDAMVASALKKRLDKHVHFRKRAKCRRAACSEV